MALTHATVPAATTWDWHDGIRNGGHVAGWAVWSRGLLLGSLLWTTLLLVLTVAVVSRLDTRYRPNSPTGDGALAVLKQRYARGEIDDAEFDRRRARLAPDDGRP